MRSATPSELDFGWLSLSHRTNRRSLAVLEKFGFSVSGVLPKAAEINGEYIDHIYLHRLLSNPKA